MAAVGTLIEMPTHGSSAAACDRDKHFDVQPGEPGRMPVDESLSRGPYDIGQLQEWPVHLLAAVFGIRRRSQRERVQGAGCGFEMPIRQVQVPAGGLQIGMAEQKLNRA